MGSPNGKRPPVCSRILALLVPALLLVLLPPIAAPARAQDRASAPDDVLQQARECLKDGDYDRATEILVAAVHDTSRIPADMGAAYLLLVNTHVQRGNTYTDQPHGRATAELWYREARQTIAECLGIGKLRHLRPVPREDYPPEMVTLFDEVRAEMFGDFRVVDLDPPDAAVILESDTLVAVCDSCPLELRDIPKGPRTVRVVRQGYDTHTEAVDISPNSILERSFALKKQRGPSWYALRVGGVAAAVAGYLIISGSDEEGPAEDQTLPEPPPPPTND